MTKKTDKENGRFHRFMIQNFTIIMCDFDRTKTLKHLKQHSSISIKRRAFTAMKNNNFGV